MINESVPKLHIRVSRMPTDPDVAAMYSWSITMKSSDSKGTRSLGYCGSGTIQKNSTMAIFDYGPAVHDEKRPVWTPMNSTDRPDIRNKLDQLAITSAKLLDLIEEDSFDYLLT